MRDIKFRAWDNKLKIMWSSVGFRDSDCGRKIYPELGMINEGDFINGYNCIEPNGFVRFILMQFTGLKDKNGKEIYEGDIIQVNTPDPIHKIYYETFIVMWQQDKMRFGLQELNKKDYSDSWAFTPKNDFEVIGNIYENSELLREKTLL